MFLAKLETENPSYFLHSTKTDTFSEFEYNETEKKLEFDIAIILPDLYVGLDVNFRYLHLANDSYLKQPFVSTYRPFA